MSILRKNIPIFFVLFLLINTNIYGQTIKLKGIVIDSVSQHPIKAVYISQYGTHYNAVSDSNGVFHLSIDTTKASIRILFSHVNYKKTIKKLTANATSKTLKIQLVQAVNRVDEVTVEAPIARMMVSKQYSMNIVGETDMKDDIAGSLIDLLEKVPGLYKKSEYHSAIVLRGLSGKRLLITKDGNRRMGNYPNGFMGETVNIYNLSKIEIIKGPGSVKYGSGAMAGIINLVSTSPFDQQGFHYRLESGYSSNDKEKNLLGSINWSNEHHAVNLSGRYCSANDFKYANGETAQNSFHTDKDAALSYQWKPSQKLIVSLDNELHLGGPWGYPKGFSGTNYLLVTNPTDNTYHTALSSTWTPDSSKHKIQTSAFYDKEYRDYKQDYYQAGNGALSYTQETWYHDFYFGGKASDEYSVNNRLTVNYGVDAIYYRISTPTDVTDHFLGYYFKNNVSRNAGVTLTGIYAEAEMQWNERLSNTLGIRANYNSIVEGEVHDTNQTAGRNEQIAAMNGMLATKYKIVPNLYLTLNLARSYRTPDANEMFINNYGMGYITYANPNLKPEYGYNFDLGLRGRIHNFSFDFSTFYYFLHQLISTEINTEVKGLNYIYTNIGRATIKGGEFLISYNGHFNRFPKINIDASSNFVVTYGNEIKNGDSWFSNGEALSKIPPFNSRQEFKISYSLPKETSVYILADNLYFAQQNKIPENGLSNPSYDVTGIGIGLSKKQKHFSWSLRTKVTNAFNYSYKPFESLIPGMGRNVKVLLSVRF